MKEVQMKRWIKISLTVVLFLLLTACLYFIGFQGDWIKPVVERAGYFGYIIFIVINIIVTTLMTFVPGMTFTFTLIATGLFGTLNGFLVSAIACFLSSLVKFIIGDKLGEPFIDWLVGKPARLKAQELVSTRATVLVPVMLAFPFFPDDAICMISGMTKMKFWYFAIVAAITRTIGVGVTSFLGGDILNYASFSILDWFLFINIIIIDIVLVWKLSTKVEEIVNKRKQRKDQEENGE